MDSNGASDIFVRDRQSGEVQLISVSPDGRAANGASSDPDVSADGRYVVFASAATDLVPTDRNGHQDVFLRDRLNRTTVRVSRAPGGRDANGPSGDPVISANGRYVAYASTATNLVTGDGDSTQDVLLFDRLRQATTLVSRPAAEAEIGNPSAGSPSMAGDGSTIAFQATDVAAVKTRSSDSAKAQLLLFDRGTRKVTGPVVIATDEGKSTDAFNPVVAPDGHTLVMLADAAALPGAATQSGPIIVTRQIG